jgi:hypothetical protein
VTDPKLVRPAWRGRTNVDALTIACIEHAESIGGHEFVVTQGSYQDGGGDANSAGTHDLGGVVDLRWCGHRDCVRALRQAGMAAWHRTPAQGPWVDHVHAVTIGHPLLADSAHRQVIAYLNGRNGLKNDGADDGPRLDPIPRPVWPWPQENDMALTDEDAKKVAQAFLDAEIAADGRTVRKALRQASKAPEIEDRIVSRVKAALADRTSLDGVLVDVPVDDLVDAVKQALREGTDD